jgi:S1-C subfamily serine protease
MHFWKAIVLAILLATGSIARSSAADSPAPIPPEGSVYKVSGTGFFVGSYGQIVTNQHLVVECLRIDVLSDTVAIHAARVVASESSSDLALLNVDVATPGILRLTQEAVDDSTPLTLLGYPSGNDTLIATESSVRAVNGLILQQVDPKEYLVLSGPVQHGNSGSPVLDARGRVVGIVIRGAGDPEAADRFFGTSMNGGGMAVAYDPAVTFLKKAGFSEPSDDTPADAVQQARRAVVRVTCWRGDLTR